MVGTMAIKFEDRAMTAANDAATKAMEMKAATPDAPVASDTAAAAAIKAKKAEAANVAAAADGVNGATAKVMKAKAAQATLSPAIIVEDAIVKAMSAMAVAAADGEDAAVKAMRPEAAAVKDATMKAMDPDNAEVKARGAKPAAAAETISDRPIEIVSKEHKRKTKKVAPEKASKKEEIAECDQKIQNGLWFL